MSEPGRSPKGNALARGYGWTWVAVGLLGVLGGPAGVVLVTVPALAAGVVALVVPRVVTLVAPRVDPARVVAVEALGVAAFFALAEWRYAERAEGLVRDYGSALHNHAFPHAALAVALLNVAVAISLAVSGSSTRR